MESWGCAPTVVEPARAVHAADVSADRESSPCGHGLWVIAHGFADLHDKTITGRSSWGHTGTTRSTASSHGRPDRAESHRGCTNG